MFSRLLNTNTAFFICDVQGCFLKSIFAVDEVIHSTSFLLKTARALEVPCFITEQYPDKLKHTVDSLLPLINETETQKAFPVFPKVDFSMLTQDVRNYLQSTLPNVKNIVLCGMETHVCVLQTCYDLMNSGYKVHLCVDAVSSRSPVDRKVALNQLQKDGAILTTTENVAFQLIGSKNHPHFRAISALVKEKELPKQLDY